MEHTLTIEECRQYLGDTNMTDKEIEELRDDLCVLIDNVLDDYFNSKYDKIEL